MKSWLASAAFCGDTIVQLSPHEPIVRLCCGEEAKLSIIFHPLVERIFFSQAGHDVEVLEQGLSEVRKVVHPIGHEYVKCAAPRSKRGDLLLSCSVLGEDLVTCPRIGGNSGGVRR